MPFMTVRMIASGLEKGQSATMPQTFSGRGSPAAIRTAAAPMETPERMRGRSLPNRSSAYLAQDRTSLRSRIPKVVTFPPLSPCALSSTRIVPIPCSLAILWAPHISRTAPPRYP